MGRGPLSGPVTEASLDISSKVLEPSTNTENLENRTDGGTSVKQTERREGDDTAGRKNDGSKKQDSNVKLEVDEFGRVVKEDSSDSGSDHYSRRRSRRDRSRSRSRSPHGRRRRRREKRSRSRSWSPKKRSRSRSPYRRNRSQLQEVCLDHLRASAFVLRVGIFMKLIRPRNLGGIRTSSSTTRCQISLKTQIKYIPKVVMTLKPLMFLQILLQQVFVHSTKLHHLLYTLSWHHCHYHHHHHHNVAVPCHYSINRISCLFQLTIQNFVRPFPMNYQIPQQPIGSYEQPGLVSSNSVFSQDPPPAGTIQSFSGENVPRTSDFASRTSSHYNPYASTFDQLMNTHFSSGVINQDTLTSLSNQYGSSVGQNHVPDVGQMRQFPQGNQYDPLFDSIDPSSDRVVEVEENSKHKAVAVAVSEENDEFGETADAEVGTVENDSPSPSSPIDQVKNSGKTKKSKDSRSMKLFKVSVADFVKKVLKPSWKQGNMSKEALKTIVKKTVDKVSGAIKYQSHRRR